MANLGANERRVHGVEIEWGLVTEPNPDDNSSVSLLWSYLPPEITWIGGNANRYLGNGCRFYTDVGEHLETATAENTSFIDTVAQEIACEQILFDTLERARNDGHIEKHALNKRVLGEFGITWGAHESYLVDRKALSINESSLALLGLFNVSRGLWAGSGGVWKPRVNRGQFVIAQKATGLFQDAINGTTNKHKPVINLRDEPHADAEKFARIHITMGDPNLSPWQSFTKLAMTSLLLRYLETERKPSPVETMTFKQPLFVIARQVAFDLSLKKNLSRADQDTTITPLEVQIEILDTLQKFVQDREVPAEEALALEEVAKACDELAVDPNLLIDRVDWVMRKKLLERYRKNHGLTWGSLQLAKKDRQFDQIHPNGIGQRLRQQGWAKWMPLLDAIAKRRTHAPETTRAHIRGKFIDAHHGSAAATVDWTTIKMGNEYVNIRDPRITRDSRVNRWVEEAKSAA